MRNLFARRNLVVMLNRTFTAIAKMGIAALAALMRRCHGRTDILGVLELIDNCDFLLLALRLRLWNTRPQAIKATQRHCGTLLRLY
jgi:hypothetical protein